MNYEIVKDEKLLLDFINWLPELEEHEIFYLALFARKKYAPSLKYSKTDKTQLKRFTSTKDRLFHKIKQLECELGSYYLKGMAALQESLALYITVNPRSQITASRNMLIKLAHLVGEPYNGHNLHQIALSEIQKAKSYTRYVDFDIDSKEEPLEDIKLKLINIVDSDCWEILETRGGYHILVDPNNANNKFWYNDIKNSFVCDVVGDNMIPVIGCTQGNFTPKFV